MFRSAAEEISEWADQCRRWTRGAATREQRLTLQGLERLLNQAAMDAEQDMDCLPHPFASSKS
jgi:hypothetical protein